MFHVIVAGSRTFADYELLKQTLDHLLQNKTDVEIVSGGARGADQLGERLSAFPKVELLGPARAALYRLKDQYRRHLILRAPHSETLQDFLKDCRDILEPLRSSTSKTKLTLEVDPMNML